MENTKTSLSVSLELPFRSPGNIIHTKPVDFEITKEEGFYKAVPLCAVQDKILFGLPEEVCFRYHKGKLLSANGTAERYLPMIANLSSVMTERDLFF